MTPKPLARKILDRIPIQDYTRILEPSCGDGSFLSAIADRLMDASRQEPSNDPVDIIGIEIDPQLEKKSRSLMENRLSPSVSHRWEVRQLDFFKEYLASSALESDLCGDNVLWRESFDLIVGNPPFGGTFDHSIEDILDARLGIRLGRKIKKETYAFFIVACVDLLRPGGRLVFVSSDTLLTIPTMTGLRHFLMEYGNVELSDIDNFSDETSYPMLLLDFTKTGESGWVTRNSVEIDRDAIRSTPNLSWGITPDLSHLFSGPLLGDYFTASSGMTTGKNELFVREVIGGDMISEPYQFEFYDAPVTLAYELERARLGKISERRRRALEVAEARGDTEQRLRVVRLSKPHLIQLPDPRYRPYNKANNRLVFSDPTHYIYWEDEGRAVLTYKRTGNWYLRGVGGQPYFGKEGITWPLVASRFNPRYLPPGHILDSGAPCAFVHEGVDRDEIFFIIGWLLSSLANRVLKTVINHTRNIQSKDFERMPYPWWVNSDDRQVVINEIKAMISDASTYGLWTREDARVRQIDDIFTLPDLIASRSYTHEHLVHAEQLALLGFE
jgi:tRNA1(Val) A37 N6-methylase TrmN6